MLTHLDTEPNQERKKQNSERKRKLNFLKKTELTALIFMCMSAGFSCIFIEMCVCVCSVICAQLFSY